MASDYLKLYEDYLREEKHASENTLSSYLRDLRQFSEHLAAQRVTDLRKVKTAAISDYVAWMGGKGEVRRDGHARAGLHQVLLCLPC